MKREHEYDTLYGPCFLFGRLVDVFDHFLLDTLQAHHRKASYLRARKVCYHIINGE